MRQPVKCILLASNTTGTRPSKVHANRSTNPQYPVNSIVSTIMRVNTAAFILETSTCSMTLHIILPVRIIIRYARMEDIAIVISIATNVSSNGRMGAPSSIPLTTAIVPDLSLPDTASAMNVNIVADVPIDEMIDTYPLLSSSPNTLLATEAPQDDVTPGYQPIMLPVTVPFNPGIGPIGRASSSSCGGMCPEWDDIRSAGIPNNPESIGNIDSGSMPNTLTKGRSIDMVTQPNAPEPQISARPSILRPSRSLYIISARTDIRTPIVRLSR